MSNGAAQNGGTQVASTGEAAAVAGAAVAATAATAAPATSQAAAAAAAPAAPIPAAVAAAAAASPAAAVVPAAVAFAQPAAAPSAADCAPPKKKVSHKHNKKEAEEEHARATTSDEDQNLSQPADGCVLPQNGAAAAEQAPAGAPMAEDVGGGGGSSGLLIGAGVLAAVGVGVLALSKGGKDKNAPPVANADTAAVNEGSSITGSVATNDTDPNNDPLTFTLTGTAPAGFTLNSNGGFTFDANNAAYNALVAGATQVLSIPYSVSDGKGGTASSTLTITVTGTNDVPVAVADVGPASNEGGAAVTGSVATNDTDADTGQTATLTYTLNAPVAGLTLNTNGTYSFNPADPAYNSLAAGQTQTVVANYTVRDASNGTATSTLTFVVTGTNDAPVAVADTAAATEGGAAVTGSVATNDSDPDQNATLAYSLNTPVAGLVLNANGTYSFDPTNAAYNSLAAGQTQAVVANYTVTDGQGATSTSTLTITVTGTNDAPVAGVTTAAATEGAAAVTGQLVGSDPDQNAVLTYTLNAPVAGLTVNPNGTFSFDPTNAAYNQLAAGQTQAVVANFTVTDAQGASSTSTLTITVTGTNDAPTVVADVAAVNEDASITGNLRTNDSDPDTNDTLTYAIVGTAPAGLTLNSNGTYTFNAANAAYQGLAAGQTQVVVANVAVSDGTGPAINTTLTITVTGTNDAPVAVADVAAGNEGAGALTGTVAANDTDVDTAAANLTYSLNAPVTGLTLNPNGTYSFDLNNPAFNALAAGQTQVVVAGYTVNDGQGGTSTANLTITVTGTNDAPVAVADTNAGLEDTTIAGSVATNDTDVDTPAANLTYTVVGTAPAGFVLNPNGTYTLDTTNAAYQNLRQGELQNVVVNYQVADGLGGTSTATLTIAVTGVVETANLDVDSDNNLNTRQAFDGGATDFNFTDDDDVANTVVINNFGADDILTIDAPFNGAGRAAFANIDFDGDGIANDLQIVVNKGGVVSDIVLRNALSNADAASVISTEAAAEAAIGAGFDNFRTTTQSVVPVTASLDVDNDNNPISTYVLPVAANTGTFAYTDDVNFANTVQVTDFGADDTITFNTALANVSFGSGDFDGDGVADDLRITVNNAGTVSDIVLTNAVAADAVVFNEATAEAAVGNGFDNFLFNGTVTPPPPPPPAGNTTASLDVDSDANLLTARVFDASADGFRFTDDADLANNAVVVNFGANDRFTLETGNLYSFANIDADGDGLANDLSIFLNKAGGVVSEVLIKNVVTDPNAFIATEAAAEIALNQAFGTTNVDYFQFA